MTNIIKKYITKRTIQDKWKLKPKPKQKKFSFIICIPSYSEHQYIENTLLSISNQNQNYLDKTLIIIVINNGPNEKKTVLSSNEKTIQIINLFKSLNICFVDAFRKGNELPEKFAGVGLARKIGLDLALNFSNQKTILCNLDADTLITENYLEKISKFYIKNKASAVVINFSHTLSKSQKINNSIKIYEKIIKETSKNLNYANSPYYYHSIGSTMTCTAEAYAAVGGMPKKKATEDFYFLESLAKYKSVKNINDVLVFPSSRISERVYLGTGFRMKQSNLGFDLNKLFFKKEVFILLKQWIELGTKSINNDIDTILLEAQKIHTEIPKFLISEKIELIWSGLKKSSPTEKHFIKQFHRWFDALKTLKFLKYFSKLYP